MRFLALRLRSWLRQIPQDAALRPDQERQADDRRKFPAIRKAFELLCRITAFHRKQSPATDTSCRTTSQIAYGSDCA